MQLVFQTQGAILIKSTNPKDPNERMNSAFGASTATCLQHRSSPSNSTTCWNGLCCWTGVGELQEALQKSFLKNERRDEGCYKAQGEQAEDHIPV